MTRLTLTLAAAVLALAATEAQADPCEAPLPKAGTVFSGQVRHVIDGDGLCVSDSADPMTWVEVRIADFFAAELNQPGGREAKRALERIAMGRVVACTAGRRSYDRVVATCRIGAASVGDLLRRDGVREGGRGR